MWYFVVLTDKSWSLMFALFSEELRLDLLIYDHSNRVYFLCPPLVWTRPPPLLQGRDYCLTLSILCMAPALLKSSQSKLRNTVCSTGLNNSKPLSAQSILFLHENWRKVNSLTSFHFSHFFVYKLRTTLDLHPIYNIGNHQLYNFPIFL